MKKLIFALSLLMALPLAAQKKTFTAACLNVDGLPPTVKAAGVYTVKLNKEGPQSVGTKQISTLVANKGWDFFGVSENFNYNDELMSELKGVYNAGTYRGKIPTSVTNVVPYLNGSKWFDTDGLNLLWRSNISVSDEAWYLWNQRNGITSDGADQLIAKGFRYYCVSVAPGMEIDVYIHHMDAETTEKDNAAREVQMNQLVDMILASNNKRPIIIMGDSNCRYTRDKIQEIMFSRINADERFTMHDPWIEFPRENVYPQVGQDAIMVPDKYNGLNHDEFQTGEVVDKVWWIENTDAPCSLKALNYLQDTDFTWPDGSEVSDHYPIVIDFEIEKTKEALTGGEYYIQNVATGKYIAAGANWGTRSVVAKTGNRITLQPNGENKFIIKSTLNYLGDNLYMDNGTAATYEFRYDNERGVYNILLNSSVGNSLYADNDDVLQFGSLAKDNPYHQWKLVTQQDLLEVLRTQASETNPIDATFMIKGANFSRNDGDNAAWEKKPGNYEANINIGDGLNVDDRWSSNFVTEFYNGSFTAISGRNSQCQISQTISNLPNGKYKISFQGFKRNGDNNDYVSVNGTNYVLADIGSDAQSTQVYVNNEKDNEWRSDAKVNGKWQPNSMQGAAAYFNKGLYKQEHEIVITNNQLSILVQKHHAASTSVWVCFDNFVLTYLGPTAETLASLDRVEEAILDAQAKADAAGLTSYSNKAVVDAWTNRLIQGDGSKEVLRTYTALATAALKQTKIPADFTYAIVNNSFEIYPDYKNSSYNIDGGYPLGWTYPSDYKKDSGVWHWKDENKSVSKSADGDYLYNTWAWGNSEREETGNTIYQELTLNPGIYELTAQVASHNGNMVYIYAGDAHAGVTTTGKQTFIPVTLRFSVPERTGVKVGVSGGAIGDNSFTTSNGHFYKADDFRLTRIADQDAAAGYELIRKAIADATARINNEGSPYNDGWAAKMQKYQDILDNYTLEGNGEKEFYEIYELLREEVFKKTKTSGTYFTNAIINNSFEFGEPYGWNVNFSGDTGVKPNSNGTYTISPVHGDYLFNTWNNGRGTIISQTIKNLPGGKWKLMAKAASDKDKYVYMEVIGQEGIETQKAQFKMANAKEKSQEIELTFNVADNTPEVTIAFGGCNADGSYDSQGGEWYKLDDIRLQYVGDADLCFFYKRLLKAIEETTEIANALPDKYSKEWDASDYQDLVDQHLADHHDPEKGEHGSIDPMGGSGVDEINELYRRLRELIFSQKETEADMTGAIVNNSFELGDLTGWTHNLIDGEVKVTEAKDNPPYTTEGADEDLLFNCYSGGSGKPIYQTIPDVRAGKYKLTVKIASDPGNKFYLAANDVHNAEPFVVTKTSDQFDQMELEFEVARNIKSKDVTIGLYPAINGDAAEFSRDDYPLNPGSWYKVDDFRLELVGRYLDIDWEMETDSHGTIILPFDVDADELEEKNLEVYTIIRSTDTETPLDPDINTYRLLEFEKVDYLHANTPYVVKNTLVEYAPAPTPENEVEPASLKRAKAAAKAAAKADENAEENSRMYSFSGYSTNTRDMYERVEGNLLVGVMEETPATGGEHHFQMQGDNVAFMLHPDDDPDAHETIKPYHAYIDHPIEQYREFVTGFYFYEPIMNLPWEMETAEYGTLILPFDAELPAELKAYRLLGFEGADDNDETVNGIRNIVIGTDAGGTYQVLRKDEVKDKTEDGLTKITANIPYFITLNSTPASVKSAKRVAPRSEETGNFSHVFTGQPTNAEETYKYDGVLRGTILTDNGVKKADDNKGVHILTADGTFEPLADDATTTIGAYHAYVNSSRADNNSTLLLEEPLYDPEWSMDTPELGTIILPYEKELPAGLEAYPINSIGQQKGMPEKTKDGNTYTNGETYQVITLGDKVNKLAAYTPYIVKPAASEENAAVPATLSDDDDLDLSGYRDHANEVATATVNGLTGVNVASDVEHGDYLAGGTAGGFEKNTRDGISVQAHHAYLKAEAVNPGESNAPSTYLVLAEPTADIDDGVAEIMAGEENVDIYTLQGVRVAHDVNAAETLRTLEPGIYVLRSGNRTIKVIK